MIYRGYEIFFSPDDNGYYAERVENGIEYYSPRVYRTKEAISRDIRNGSIKMEPRHQRECS